MKSMMKSILPERLEQVLHARRDARKLAADYANAPPGDTALLQSALQTVHMIEQALGADVADMMETHGTVTLGAVPDLPPPPPPPPRTTSPE